MTINRFCYLPVSVVNPRVEPRADKRSDFMSRSRIINTCFWSDSFVVGLDPLERYLFLYFLTNEHTNVAGIYELALPVMARETGLDKEMLEKMLPRFEVKIFYIDGWIYLKNFQKHQRINDKMRVGIENVYKSIPKHILAKIDRLSKTIKDFDISKLKSESKLKPKLKLESEIISTTDEPWREGVNQVFKVFYETVNPQINFGRKPWREAAKELVERYGAEETVALAKLAVSIQGQPFSPVITNPYQLKEKLSALQIFTVKLNQPKKGAIQSL
jgi:hypothetical protein